MENAIGNFFSGKNDNWLGGSEVAAASILPNKCS